MSEPAKRLIDSAKRLSRRESHGCRPFLKWAGGKTSLLSEITARLPSDVERRRHVEPFLGGGALFFARAPRHALLSDTNHELINTYLHVQKRPNDVLQELYPLTVKHWADPEVAYVGTRTFFNSKQVTETPLQAAFFIYLNKTCFNGLYRVNLKGHFNVPYGRHEKPNIMDEEAIREASRVLSTAVVRTADFLDVLSACGPEDFVYCDPPYLPIVQGSFTSYASGGFDEDDHAMLAGLCRRLHKRGAKFLVSNADVPLTRELYAGFRMEVVAGRRSISASGAARGFARELLIRNY